METRSSHLRTVIVTGSNKGIGYSIIETLLLQSDPHTIILTARNPILGNKAVEDLLSKYKNSSSNVVFRQLDVDNTKSIDDFIEWIKTTYGKADALVNNAGVGASTDSIEERLQILKTNVSSVINLTEKLLPYLTDDAKIINISSGLGILNLQKPNIRETLNNEKLTENEFYDLYNQLIEKTKDLKQAELGFSESTYFASKALLNTYTRWLLPKKLKGEQQAFSVCPGWCRTDMGSAAAHRSVEQGSATPVWLLNLPWKRDDRLNTQFVRDKDVIDYTIDSYDVKTVFGLEPINN